MKKYIFSLAILLLGVCNSINAQSRQTRKPVIGITMYVKDGVLTVAESYVRAVEAAGGIPHLLSMSSTPNAVRSETEILDGVIFSGGEDISPLRYGDQPCREIGKVNAARDSAEVLIFQCAQKRGIPMLGICRGMQFINVMLGGTLVQDIPSQWKNAIQHKQLPAKDVATHTVNIVKGTKLWNIMNTASVDVNSFHHQCVKDCAGQLRVSAYSTDGVPEALESIGDGKILGVQFHPEGLFEKNKVFLTLFAKFVEEARKENKDR